MVNSKNIMEKNKTLGVLGGIGPMSTVYFYELLTSMTDAACDQDHLDIVISSRATTPDRTAFIVGESDDDPLDAMIPDAKRLVDFGADMIAIPCNTAHYFYDQLQAAVPVPMLNIIDESVKYLKGCGVQRFGLLATDGTVRSQTYQKYCQSHGIECLVPSEADQRRIMQIIYGEIKSGNAPDLQSFYAVADAMRSLGCERLILGCTELSLIKKSGHLDEFFVDSLECLARSSILACGKQLRR